MKKKIIVILVCTLVIFSTINAIAFNVEDMNVQQDEDLKLQDNKIYPIKQRVDLHSWEEVYFEFGTPHEEKGKWTLSSDQTHAIQETNCYSCFLLHPKVKNKWNVACKFKIIYPPNSDDDWIGFTFGYRNKGNFFIVDWRSDFQDHKTPGFSIKQIEEKDPLSMGDFKTTVDTNNTKILDSQYVNGTGWKYNIWYDFNLEFKKGDFTVIIKEGSTILYTKKITGGIFTAGRFGFYSCSQENVIFGGFIDQQQPETDEIHWLEPNIDNWQQFTNLGNKLEAVELHVGCYYSGSPQITLYIKETLSGSPLSQVTYLATDLPQEKQDWLIFDIPDVNLQYTKVYYIILKFDVGAEYAWSGAHNNPYIYGGSSHPDPDWDYAFKTIIDKSKTAITNNPLILFLNNHPLMFPILRQLIGL